MQSGIVTVDGATREKMAILAAVMRFMAELYHRAPTEDTLVQVRGIETEDGDDFVMAEPSCHKGLRLMRTACGDMGALQSIRNDFHDLFVGPHELLAVPWSSVYMDSGRMLFGPTAIKVREVFAAEGFAIPEGKAEPSDHVAYEWQFMADLHRLALEAQDDGDGELARRRLELAAGFFDRFLRPWMGPFCDCMDRGAKTGFFRGLAWFTRGVVQLESALLASLDLLSQ